MDKNQALHVAIIPDGNRRWAKARTLQPWNGHEKAIENFRSLTEWCRNDPRVSTLTVWCFSTENWKRDETEIEKLMTMLEDYLKEEGDGFIEKETRFLHSGRRDRLPSSLIQVIEETEEKTKDQTGFTLNLAVDYGGKDEILRAITKIEPNELNQLNEPNKPTNNELTIRNHLDHPELPDIDLIIRTSGEQRTSNFFLWQSTYAEWDFCKKLFPDFSAEDLKASVDNFTQRNRRFGA
ncbi:MAG: di-trans,poly-cis-decaprenylcistransferase [Kiritimatiellales bacterium]|nr:di-trans,poly-cis-decaprenylcistransferase [Kiritimatiellales bacterium]